MSSFWNRVTGANEEKPAPEDAPDAPQSAPVAAATPAPAYGIAQANKLMATLAMGDDADMVVRIIRTTLESVGVRVGDLITEGKTREGALAGEIDQRRQTIAQLEQQIEAERRAIAALESDLALTARTREGLERSEARRNMPPLPPAVRAPAPEKESDNDRPTVMAVGKGDVVVVGGADVESIPPAQPTSPPKESVEVK